MPGEHVLAQRVADDERALPPPGGHQGGPCSAPGDAGQAADAVLSLIERLLPGRGGLFRLACDPAPPGSHGFFTIAVRPAQEDGGDAAGAGTAGGGGFAGGGPPAHVVRIRGSSGVELASGLHWFLKHWASCSVSWEATGGAQVSDAALSPAALAALAGRPEQTVERAVEHTFYQNVVTMSYSMAFWEWERWEAELDWMALQGVNLPLMPLGAEALALATFGQLGLSPQQLEDFFPGPAFLAWGRMGNIQGYGGPLPPEYAAKQLALARRVVERMRELGMTPVYPAFAGFVPRALAALHPDARVTPASNWCNFPKGYCCPCLLDPSDPLFARVGAAYISTLRAHLGWDRRSFYIADTFNEMRPASGDAAYLAGVSASVFAGMAAADAGAVWVMQAWLFFSDSGFWQPPQIKALLSGVPRGRLVLLDLFADEHPVWTRTEAMYGTPFIWVMLHNFGGNSGLYGALPRVAEGVSAALAAAPGGLAGVGMAPEGIEQNPAVYEFMAEMAYRGAAAAAAAPGGLAAWFRGYAARRCAAAGPLPPAAAAALGGAWQLLARSAYSCRDGLHSTVCDIPTSRPGLCRAEITGWGLAPHLWYDPGDVRAAWELLLQAAAAAPRLGEHSSAFAYDLLDVSRELMSKIAGRFWADAADAYRAGQPDALRGAGRALTALLADMDALLGCHRGFMLGPALARARAYAGGGGAAAAAALDRLEQRPEEAQWHGSGGAESADSSLTRTGGSSGSLSSDGAGAPLQQPPPPPPPQSQQQQPQPQRERVDRLASLYELNLRTQLTIWGTSAAAGDSEVSDYANKEWSGLISSFYLPRWRAWLQRLEQDLLLGRPYDAAAWRLEVLAMTSRWVATGSAEQAAQGAPPPPPPELAPRGNAVALSAAAYERYGRLVLTPAGAGMAAAAAAAAAAGMEPPPAAAAAPPQPLPAAAPAAAAPAAAQTLVAAAAAAVVVGAAGAAAAAVATAGAGAAAPAFDEVAA